MNNTTHTPSSAHINRAVVADTKKLHLTQLPIPRIDSCDQLLIRVVVAGICRTDSFVATRHIPVNRPTTLGHELAGVVVDCGYETDFNIGDRVTVDPSIPCQSCHGCLSDSQCYNPKTLGIDCDGCFADYLLVTSHVAHHIPETMTPFEAAYVEPVAAALGIFNTGIQASDRGCVLGKNRFARLIRNLLRHYDFQCLPEDTALTECSLDYIIETGLDANELGAALNALIPGGTLVLKSRHTALLPWKARDMVLKNLRVHAALAGSFSEAITLLQQRHIHLPEDQIRVVPLEDYKQHLLIKPESEVHKSFFTLKGKGWPACVD